MVRGPRNKHQELELLTWTAILFQELLREWWSLSRFSTVDTGNQLLLLHGLRRAARPPSRTHPFGHGLELYFWTFVVAILIFGLGAGISILEGINKIRTPHPVESPLVNYLVLGAALVFEGVV